MKEGENAEVEEWRAEVTAGGGVTRQATVASHSEGTECDFPSVEQLTFDVVKAPNWRVIFSNVK